MNTTLIPFVAARLYTGDDWMNAAVGATSSSVDWPLVSVAMTLPRTRLPYIYICCIYPSGNTNQNYKVREKKKKKKKLGIISIYRKN